MMKPIQFYILIGLGAGCLILSIVGIALANSNQKLQAELQSQQVEINRGNASQQVGSNIIRDIASVAGSSQALRDVLTRAGFTLKVNPAPSPATSGSSKASPTP